MLFGQDSNAHALSSTWVVLESALWMSGSCDGVGREERWLVCRLFLPQLPSLDSPSLLGSRSKGRTLSGPKACFEARLRVEPIHWVTFTFPLLMRTI